MKGVAMRRASLVLLVIGIAVLLFPVVSDWISRLQMGYEIDEFNRQAQEMRTSSNSGETDEAVDSQGFQQNVDLDALLEQMKAYNENLYLTGQSGLVDPFSYEQPSFDLRQYGLSNNAFGYLEIPKMHDLRMPIYLGAGKQNMSLGAAQLSQTSIPIGGINTNTVIAGHRGAVSKAMFRYIHLLQTGDDVWVTNLWGTMHYRVSQIEIIEPTDVDKVLIQPGRDLVTLMTCTPLGKNYERYVVYCERVE